MISKHISLQEGIKSITAIRLGIDNSPMDDDMDSMVTLAKKIFEPLRSWVGGPIKIN